MNRQCIFILVIILYLVLKNNKINEHFHNYHPYLWNRLHPLNISNNLWNRMYPLYTGIYRYLRDGHYYNQKYYYDPYINSYYIYNPFIRRREYIYNDHHHHPIYRTKVTYKRR